MKLALIRKTYTAFGGAERHVDRFIDAVLARGYDVHLFAARWPGSGPSQDGVTVHRVPVVPGPRWAEVWSFAVRASRMAAAGGFDLVHSFDRVVRSDVYRAGDGVHREWLRRRRLAQPVWRRAIPSLNPLHLVYLALERGLFEGNCRAIIANSERGKAEILAHYRADPGRIRVIRNGVDVGRFVPPDEEARRKARALGNVAEGERVVLLAGSGFERKGVTAAIRVMPHLSTCPTLVVAGRGDPGRYLRLAASLGVADRVRFVGPVPDMLSWYHAADALLLPTLYDPFANVVLEALACGLPVVTTAANGAAEVLTGDTGVVVDDPLGVDALARAVDRVLSWGRSRAGACRAAAERFPQGRQVEATLALYDALRATAGRG